MITLLKIFPDKWEQAKGYLRLDLEAIEAAMNQRWSVTFGASNLLKADTIAGDHDEDTFYVSNEGTDHEPYWAQVNLSNGVKNRLPFANFVAATAGSKLVGRGAGAGGDFEEISLGSGLMMQGTFLSINPSGFPTQDESYNSYDPWNTAGGINTGQALATGFTPGSVLFVGPGGLFAQDNSNFFWDDTNNRLGIGITPGGTLDVSGSFTADQAFAARFSGTHSTATAGTVYGGQYNAIDSHTSGTMNSVVGLTNAARFQGTANTSNMTGEQCFYCIQGGSPSGTITTAQALNISQISNFASGTPAVTFTQARGIIIGDIGSTHGVNGLTVTNSSALSIAGSQTAATNSVVINISNTTSVPFAPSGTWAIYNASTRNNHIAGPILLGHTSTWGSGTNFISFADGTVPGTPASNTAAIYANDVGGTTKMFAIDEAGVAGEIATNAGALTSGRVALVTTSGQLTDDAGITYDAATNRINVDQLKFPASQSASADANTLDDYEEGSWTPTIGGTTSESGQVYTTQTGTYVKIGQFVYCSCLVKLSTLGTITGGVCIKGLPFVNESNYSSSTIGYFTALTTSVVAMKGFMSASVSFAELFMLTAAGTGMTAMVQADLSNTTDIRMAIMYRTTS